MNKAEVFKYEVVDDVHTMDPIVRDDIAEREFVNILNKSFPEVEEIITELLTIIQKHFQVECVKIIENKTINKAHLELRIEW